MELLDALRLIREECKKHESCELCPLRSKFNDDCALGESDQPANWDLYEDTTVPKLIL